MELSPTTSRVGHVALVRSVDRGSSVSSLRGSGSAANTAAHPVRARPPPSESEKGGLCARTDLKCVQTWGDFSTFLSGRWRAERCVKNCNGFRFFFALETRRKWFWGVSVKEKERKILPLNKHAWTTWKTMDVQPRDVEDQQRGERLLAGGEKLAP